MTDELYSYDSELAVLNILLKNPDLIFKLTHLKYFMFTAEPHRIIFDTFDSIAKEGNIPDKSLLDSKLQASGKLQAVGGSDYLKYLYSLNHSSENLSTFERLLVDSYKTRAVISIAAEVKASIKSTDGINEIISGLKQKLDSLEEYSGGEETSIIGDLVSPAMDFIIEKAKSPGISGKTFGIKGGNIDLVTGGINPGEFWVIGSRPSMGKTSIMCNSAVNSALAGNRIAIFSLEMRKQPLIERILATLSGVPFSDIRLGNLDAAKIGKLGAAAKILKDLNLYIDSNFFADVNYIESTIRRLNKMSKLDIVYLDYLQLLAERSSEATHILGQITRLVKLLSNDLSMGIVLLSQVNRECEKRDDKRPILADLRQSGNIEEDADVVAFLYRDIVYNSNTKDRDTLEFIIRKQRNGPTGTIFLNFNETTNSIVDR